MGKNCEFIYYDKNGKLSTTYYTKLKENGKDSALNAYLYEMMSNEDTHRFELSKKDTAKIEAKLNKSISTKELKKKGYTSFSSTMREISPYDENKVLSYMAINIKTTDLMSDPRYKNHSWIEVQKIVRDDIFKFNRDTNTSESGDKSIKEEFDNYKIDAFNLQELQREGGTGIHLLFEKVFEERLDGGHKSIEGFDSYYNLAMERYKDEVENDSQLLSKTMLESLRPVMKNIIRDIAGLEQSTGATFKIFTEKHISSDKVKLNGKPTQAIMDLMVYDTSNNIAYLFDFKTKSEQSYLNMDRKTNPYLKAPFDTIQNTATNKARIQLSLSKKILEVEYGINVSDISIITVVSAIGHNDESVGNRSWEMKSVNALDTNTTKVDSYEIGEVADEHKKIPVRKSPDDVINDLFSDKLVTTTSSSKRFIQSQEINIKENIPGEFVWFDIFEHKSIKKSSKEELRKEIKISYDKSIEIKKKAAAHLTDLFNNGVATKDMIWKSNSYASKAYEILLPFTTNEFELKTSRDLPELADIGPDIIIARNKISGEVTLISLAAAYDSVYTFHEDGNTPRSSILGQFLDDDAVDKLYGLDNIPKATTHSLSVFRLSLIADALKRNDNLKYNKIGKLMSVTLRGSEYNFLYSSVEKEIGVAKMIAKAMEDSEEDVPTELALMIKNKRSLSDDQLKKNIFEDFMTNIKNRTDPLTILQRQNGNLNKYSIENVTNKLRVISEDLERAKYDMSYYYGLKKSIDEYYILTFSSIMSTKGMVSKEKVYTDSTFNAVNKAFLAFNDLLVLENPKFKRTVIKSINSLTTINDPLAEKLHLSIEKYTKQARMELIDPIEEHLKLQNDLMKTTPGVNLLNSIFTADNSKKVFKDMMEDGFEFDPSNINNWMKFKDPEKQKGNTAYLTAEQRDYIKFFIKQSKLSMIRLFPTKTSNELLYGDNIPEGKWDDRFIPIVPLNVADELRQTMSLKVNAQITVTDILESAKKVLNSFKKKPLTGTQQNTNPHSFISFFTNQVDSAPGRGSRETRNLLRITEDGSVLDEKRKIETNPAVILNIMMIEASRKEHMQAATLAAMAVDADLAYKNEFGGVNTEDFRKFLKSISDMKIHNRVEEEEGTLGTIVDVLRKGTSFALFTGSVSQLSTEGSTAFLQNTSQMIANGINSVIFKGDNLYSMKDRLWAQKEIASDFGRQAMNGLGMYNSSLGVFTTSDYVAMKDKFAFQTKHAYWAIKTILQQNFEAVILAQMKKVGIDKAAYDYNKETKSYTYNEMLDTRFYVYEPNLEIEGQKKIPPKSGSDDFKKWKFWQAVREKMIMEGGIDRSNNRMLKPFTTEELQAFKHHSLQLFGPMDASETLAAEANALGRAGLVFKRWIRQKAANYYTEKGKSYKVGKWAEVKNESGVVEYKYEWEDFEGYLQSLNSLLKDIYKYKNIVEAVGNLTPLQKRNLSKLLADLLLYLTLILISVEVGIQTKKQLEKESKKKAGSSYEPGSWQRELYADTSGMLLEQFKKGIINGMGDILPFLAIDSVLSGSTFAALAITLNSTKQAAAASWYAITGDFDNSITAADKTLNLFGGYRTSKGLVGLFLD